MAATGQAPYRMEVVRAAHTYLLMCFFVGSTLALTQPFFL